jgi:isoleucyl-tRNA synthetase
VQLQGWPLAEDGWKDPALEEVYEKLLGVRDVVTKALEEKRSAKELGTSLEAAIKLVVPPSVAEVLTARKDFLPSLFIVSQVEIATLEKEGGVQVVVGRALGEKCSRCWNYRTSVGQDAVHPEICDRCLPVVAEATDT